MIYKKIYAYLATTARRLYVCITIYKANSKFSSGMHNTRFGRSRFVANFAQKFGEA